jgi:peptide/nickel transport system substrate-binding protein
MLKLPKGNLKMILPILGGLLLIVALACGSSDPTAAPATAVPTATTASVAPPSGTDGKYGGDIRMSAYADTRDWDPVGSGSLSSIQAYSQLYNQIVQFDTADPTKVVCDLCLDWQVSNAGETVTFNLNPNVKWQDGEDLTADDVVFSMARYMDPENPIGRSGLFRNYTLPTEEGGVKAIGRDTVEFNLQFPSGAFINFLALDYSKVLPKHQLEAGLDLNLGETIIANKSGSGPFVLDEYQRGNGYSVSKNPNYFKEGRPYFDSIDHFIITDTGTLIAQFKAGQLEMMNGGFSNLGPTEYQQLDADTVGSPNGHVVAHFLGGTRNWGLMINRKAEPFTDPKIRKAIYLALDRAQLNDLVEDNTADAPCPMMGMGFSFDECSQWPGMRAKDSPGGEEDLALAKKLMAEAGVPDGFTTKYDVRQVGNYPDTCTVVKQQLEKNLGIKGEIATHESAAGYALYATSRDPDSVGDWELSCQGEGMTVLDADALIGGVYLDGATRNYTNWETPRMRELFERQKVEQNPDARREILKELESYLVPTNVADLSQGYEDNHWVTLFWGQFFWLVHEDIQGFVAPKTVQYGFKHEDLWLDR